MIGNGPQWVAQRPEWVSRGCSRDHASVRAVTVLVVTEGAGRWPGRQG
ncbi:hypothetical protein OHB12_10060 [Nocardia sp. NBC_01730]|nr:hypothetical protein OHB12_10060 [Nocardia sp. NBC_01730]